MSSEYWTLHKAPSDSPKKWAVRVPTESGSGKTVLFGARGYEDFTMHHDIERRERYRTRHQRDRLDDPYAPGFWAMWALWGESDDLETAFADAVRRAKRLLSRKNPQHEARYMKSNIKHFVDQALEALQFLEEKDGPDTVQEYVRVLTTIQAELGKRITASVEMID